MEYLLNIRTEQANLSLNRKCELEKTESAKSLGLCGNVSYVGALVAWVKLFVSSVGFMGQNIF